MGTRLNLSAFESEPWVNRPLLAIALDHQLVAGNCGRRCRSRSNRGTSKAAWSMRRAAPVAGVDVFTNELPYLKSAKQSKTKSGSDGRFQLDIAHQINGRTHSRQPGGWKAAGIQAAALQVGGQTGAADRTGPAASPRDNRHGHRFKQQAGTRRDVPGHRGIRTSVRKQQPMTTATQSCSCRRSSRCNTPSR